MDFVCPCNFFEKFTNENNIMTHMDNCQLFNSQSPLCKLFSKIKAMRIEQLLTLKCDLQLQLQRIQSELQESFNKKNVSQQNLMNLQQNEKQTAIRKTNSVEQQQKILCESCRKQFSPDFEFDQIWYLELCAHAICRKCLGQQIIQGYVAKEGKLLCSERSCNGVLTQIDIIEIIGKERYMEFDQKLALANQNIVCCSKCKSQYAFEIGKNTEIVKDNHGKQLEGQALDHYSKNRFVCRNQACKTEQCKSCGISPFHTGFTCQDFKKVQASKKCRLCESPINLIDQNAHESLQLICQAEDCQKRKLLLCLKKLNCGHLCQGILNETSCLPCLNANCTKGQNEDDYCNVCFIEPLKSSPCIRSTCGHIFHQECVTKKLEYRWNGPRISFNYCMCPLCKVWMDFSPEFKDLQTQIEKQKKLQKMVENNAMERLDLEGKVKDKELNDPKHQFYKKPLEYAMAIFCFYECFKCKQPYFGGLKSCQNNLDDDKRNFNKEDLICPECCPISFETKCKKHGNKYIEFKCRFCCSPAIWFCFGTTHFCDPCHMKAGSNVAQPCKGLQYCPLKVDHKPNGEECALGCFICRQKRMDSK